MVYIFLLFSFIISNITFFVLTKKRYANKLSEFNAQVRTSHLIIVSILKHKDVSNNEKLSLVTETMQKVEENLNSLNNEIGFAVSE